MVKNFAYAALLAIVCVADLDSVGAVYTECWDVSYQVYSLLPPIPVKADEAAEPTENTK